MTDETRIPIAKAKGRLMLHQAPDILCPGLQGPGKLGGLRGIARVPVEKHPWFTIGGRRLAR